MKPMSTKCKVINVLIMNIPVALFISLTAQLLAIAAGEAPGFSFPLLGMNFCLAYACAFLRCRGALALPEPARPSPAP